MEPSDTVPSAGHAMSPCNRDGRCQHSVKVAVANEPEYRTRLSPNVSSETQPATSRGAPRMAPESLLGRQLAKERFRVERTLGAGGMGVVYEAYDRERDEAVALKHI